ncbi:MAG: sialidase family protein [Gemmatimonadaceae bacterium]
MSTQHEFSDIVGKFASESFPAASRRRKFSFSTTLFAVIAFSTIACESPPAVIAPPKISVVDTPAPVGSAQPGVTVGPLGTLYLSWQERRADSSVALRYVFRANPDAPWSAVHEVQTGKNIMASGVDVPTIHEQTGGRLIAVWRGSHDTKGYDVVLAHSDDQGKTWSTAHSPHRDSTTTEHGFTSWLQMGDTSALVWVDGRHHADADKATQNSALTLAMFDPNGEPEVEKVLDPKICDCCHTSSALVPGGAVVVYRDRHDGEIRDISAIRLFNGTWREPVSVHNDNWHITGCPVNGPAVSAQNANVVVAWFTAANDSARVRVAFSKDTANTFSAPIEVNEGFPDGRVGVVLTPNGTAVVSWIERRGAVAVLRVRTVTANGARSATADIAELGEGKRAGGAPKLIANGNKIIVAWADAATNRVKLAEVQTAAAPHAKTQ